MNYNVEFLKGLEISLFVWVTTFIIIWIIALFVLFIARRNRKDLRSVIPIYTEPDDISPVFARYILTAGRQGGFAGEISTSGLQIIALIDLYEAGFFKKLVFVDDVTLEYEVNLSFDIKKLKEDQVLLANYLKDIVGVGRKIVEKNKENSKEGFKEINKFWGDYWHSDLYNLSISRGYFKKSKLWISALISIFVVSLIFGLFFGVFALFIPFVGLFIAGFLVFPALILFLFAYFLEIFLSNFFNIVFPSFTEVSGGLIFSFVIVYFFSYFFWIFVFGQNTRNALTRLTSNGKDILLKINGYKHFLKKVDKDRISISLNRELDYQRNKTTFAWLAIFSVIKNKHWDMFYEVHNK